MPYRSFFRLTAAGVAVVLSLSQVSCDTPTGQGAGIGAASGAVIGGSRHEPGRRRGGGRGHRRGGGRFDRRERRGIRLRAYGPRPTRGYPEATRTDRKGFVISPYAPYHEIDVEAIPRGALVRDPSCNRLFVNP